MANLFGKEVNSVSEILAACGEHGDRVRGTYVVRYRFDMRSADPYAGARLERPAPFKGLPHGVVYPWEDILVAAANCAGSDYPMLAEHYGIPLDAVEIELSAVFDPRGEFAGLGPEIPDTPANRHCYQSFAWKATLVSDAPRADLEKLHQRVLARNMVLDALRAVPLTGELAVMAPMAKKVR